MVMYKKMKNGNNGTRQFPFCSDMGRSQRIARLFKIYSLKCQNENGIRKYHHAYKKFPF